MSLVRHEGTHSLYDLFGPMLGLLGRVVEQVRGGGHGDEELDALRELLEGLPLTTEEFGLASTRMGNAHRYVKADEHGAARWELNALRGQLQRQLHLQTGGRSLRHREMAE